MRVTTRVLAGTGLAVTAAVALSACSATAAPSSAPAPPSEQEIAALFPAWNAALATGDPQRVADLYAPDAVLLPTVSNQVRADRAGIVDYFTKFLQNKPKGTINQEIVEVLDADTAVNTGVYTFELTQNGQPQQVQARYTYVYERIDGKWLIVNHHSSAMPEG
ncbi:SgcJ/EcaC family oxidoreductase [Amycolatopsis sp. YIM 10]|uniref:SgcJ/EcaC family oxidoreductase n=1 Tax=Amycolatopsis sp. YIM 10 TaxID=2653857 RepID=UPI00128FE168|nr:SgcJ/EcaC family oxidoreductase [Amycolatopsis sp. YIM 10]QFU91157.1 Calcium/calmodulin dependent protein kinase II Association [Amycolatopsis sp. YIM 10]